ncbi:MAG: polysaccharide biosynthesis/export family protein [Thermodesulfobacteriota bacterium]
MLERLFSKIILISVLILFFGFFSFNLLHAGEVEGRSLKNYTIGPEDVLDIRVWENPKLSVVVPVRPDGKITVPLVGDMLASGMEPLKLKKALEASLSSYIQNPTVTVIVQSINSLNIFLLGGGVPNSVITPKRELSLMQLLSQIGSLENADLEGAFLLRGDERLEVDFYRLAVKGDVTQDIPLSPGDVVFIPSSFAKRIQIVGAVNNPMTLSYRKGLTILDAVLLAGGLTEFANSRNLVIIRKDVDGGSTSEMHVRYRDITVKGDIDENVELMPGDMIIVKEGIL